MSRVLMVEGPVATKVLDTVARPSLCDPVQGGTATRDLLFQP